MDLLKIQTELLKAVVKGGKYGFETCWENKIAFTTDGYVLYLLDADKLHVRLDNEEKRSPSLRHYLPGSLSLNGMYQLDATDEFKTHENGMAQKYLFAGQTDKPIWLDPKRLKHFTRPRLMQRIYNPRGGIVVVEYKDDDPTIAGCVVPVNMKK